MPDPTGPLGTAPPHGVLGLNASVVYGENLQIAVGLNHQLAIGSNFQICINPAGLLAEGGMLIPGADAFTPLLGSGIGGNMQLTIGTSASVVYGQAFDINLGPAKITLNGGSNKDDAISYGLCSMLGAATLAWVILYGILDGDIERANEAIIFQVVFDLLLVAILDWEMTKKQASTELEKARAAFYTAAREAFNPGAEWSSFGASTAVLSALAAPLVMVALEEGK